MHWDVWGVRAEGVPSWRAQLCDNGQHTGSLFTFYTLDGVIGLVKHHDRRYPVYLMCPFSARGERAARIALERAGLTFATCVPF